MFSKDLGLSQDLINAVKAITEASCSAKKMEKEELHPNQVKLDKNKNGKLDSDDFKKLRKEEENLEEADGTVNSGRAQHGLDGDDEKKEHADYMKKKHNVTTKYHSVKDKSGASYDDELSYHGSKENVKKAIKDHYGPSMGQEAKEFHPHLFKEEVEELDELSKGTLANYTQKAAHDVGNKMRKSGIDTGISQVARMQDKNNLAKSFEKDAAKTHSKALTRLQGIKTATKKLAKEDFEEYSLEEIQDFMMSEDFEQLDELSKKTLGSYVKKAANNMGQHGVALAHKKASADEVDRMTNRNDIANKFDAQDKMKAALGADSKSIQKDYDKIGKRQSGISKAVNKLTKEQVEEIEMLAAKHGLGE